MPITATQRLRRVRTAAGNIAKLGGSDVASLFGLNPYQTEYDLWASRVFGLTDESDPGDAALLGDLFEEPLIAWAEHERGGNLGRIRRNCPRAAPDYGGEPVPIKSNIDGIAESDGTPLDAKTAALLWGGNADDWGEPGTDDVPERVILQCHAHMLCAEAGRCYVVAKVGPRRPSLYTIRRNEPLVAEMVRRARVLWHEHILTGEPPPNSVPSPEVMRLIRRVTLPSPVPIDAQLIAALDAAKAQLREAQHREEQAKAAVVAAMRDPSTGEYCDWAQTEDGRTVTYRLQQRRAYTVAETEYRALRIAPSKAQKGNP